MPQKYLDLHLPEIPVGICVEISGGNCFRATSLLRFMMLNAVEDRNMRQDLMTF